MGGASTYAVNLAHALSTLPPEHEYLFYVPTKQAGLIRGLAAHVKAIGTNIGYEPLWKHFLWDQWTLRDILRSERVDLLFSASNLSMFFCPCRQVLLVRNSLYFSPLYRKQILPQKRFGQKAGFFLRRWLICLSAYAADKLVVPSQSMLDDLSRAVSLPNSKTAVNPYGTFLEKFSPAKDSAGSNRAKTPEVVFLYVTHYADYKNFSTVLEGFAKLKRAGVEPFRFITTADPEHFNSASSVSYREDIRLFQHEELRGKVKCVGAEAYGRIQALYHRSDILLFASLAESFGHPLVEAMAAGVAILASDIPVHREICGDAALYFDPLGPDDLAEKMQRLMENSELRIRLASNGKKRANLFRFQDHVERLMGIFNFVLKG